MISFGKYKNQSFEYVFERDVKYCNWILTQTTNHKGMNEFKTFLKNNHKINIPKGNINCSVISNYYNNDNTFLNLIKDLTIHTTNIPIFVHSINDIPSSICGVYVDYFMRYKINYYLQTEFQDRRCEIILGGMYPSINNDMLISTLKIKYNVDTMEEINEFIFELVNNSYHNMKHFVANDNDILNVSLCHFLFFGEVIAYEYFDYIKTNHIYNNNYEFNEYIQIKLHDRQNVLCNPVLGNEKLMIGADADLIVDNELIDVKYSKYHKGDTIQDYIQLFIYISLYFMKTGIKCEKITILNPMLGYEKYIDLQEWDKFDEIIDILEKRVSPL